ncbi:HAD-IIA family hydrolase [Proteiniclasticum sp.]|uniref:HAD-IIA family hydrolase n=1 Tax=Proteiniclasticum sp. TaxID=2053595 RepID=UPI0028A13DD3|nr:HAD-IIA family hydrolase [Proteiniclasticum sp.]
MNNLKEKDTFLLDMDGTIFLGNELIDGASDFLDTLKQNGKRYIFLTNNSSKNRMAYVDKLRNLGLDVTAEDIFTSGEATTRYLKNRHEGARIYLLGTPSLEEEFIREGFQLVNGRGEKVDFVVLGFDTTLTYEKVWIACEYIAAGVEYIATHPDFVCPLPGGAFMPDAGAMAAMIEASTGKKPFVIGKPNKAVVESIALKYALNQNEMVMVGDRLYTDVQTGINAGITSILVYSGETKPEDYEKSTICADFVFPSVKYIIDQVK